MAVDAMILGGRSSGVGVVIAGLVEGLGDVAGSDRLLIARRSGYDNAQLYAPAVEHRVAPAWASCRIGRIFYENYILPKIARRWGADLLHSPGYLLPSGWRGPSAVTVHDLLALNHPEWGEWTGIHFRMTIGPSLRRADAVVVHSQAVKDDVIRSLDIDADKIYVVDLGIDDNMRPAVTDKIRAVRDMYDLPERYILWVSNIEPKKNVGGMVEAFERAAGRIPHDFALAGRVGWKAEASLRAIENSPQSARIHRLGYVPGKYLPALYSGADLLLHWSLYEGAGLTPLEAMACGTPAIVSDAGALPELAGQKAAVVPLGRPDALADKIVQLITGGDDDIDRENMTQWAQGFTWQKYARQMFDVYRQLV